MFYAKRELVQSILDCDGKVNSFFSCVEVQARIKSGQGILKKIF